MEAEFSRGREGAGESAGEGEGAAEEERSEETVIEVGGVRGFVVEVDAAACSSLCRVRRLVTPLEHVTVGIWGLEILGRTYNGLGTGIRGRPDVEMVLAAAIALARGPDAVPDDI